MWWAWHGIDLHGQGQGQGANLGDAEMIHDCGCEVPHVFSVQRVVCRDCFAAVVVEMVARAIVDRRRGEGEFDDWPVRRQWRPSTSTLGA